MTTTDLDSREVLDLAEDVLARHCTVDYLRERLAAGGGHDSRLWSQLAQVGVLGLLAPESYGGVELEPGRVAAVLEATGRYALPEPFLENTVIAVLTLAEFADDHRVASDWLRRIVAGDAVAAVQVPGADPGHAAHGAGADVLLVIADDDTVRVLGPGEFLASPLRVVDELSPIARVTFDSGAGALLGPSPGLAERTSARTMAGAACVLAGVARGLLETTVEYVGVRHQFGRPVGSYQAVKHKLASIAVMVELARSAALNAFEQVNEPGAVRRAMAAKAYANRAADLANVDSLALHGGIGFTWEHHLHLWMKRAMGLSSSYGTTADLQRRLAREVVATVVAERRLDVRD